MSIKEVRRPGLWDLVLEKPQFQDEQVLEEIREGRYRIRGRGRAGGGGCGSCVRRVEVTAHGRRGMSVFLG